MVGAAVVAAAAVRVAATAGGGRSTVGDDLAVAVATLWRSVLV
jgi:hypothetical protein